MVILFEFVWFMLSSFSLITRNIGLRSFIVIYLMTVTVALSSILCLGCFFNEKSI